MAKHVIKLSIKLTELICHFRPSSWLIDMASMLQHRQDEIMHWFDQAISITVERWHLVTTPFLLSPLNVCNIFDGKMCCEMVEWMMHYFISVLKCKLCKIGWWNECVYEVVDLNCVSVVCVLVRCDLIWIELFVNGVSVLVGCKSW